MKKIWFILLPLVFFCEDLTAQGFNSFNDRNHPWIDWQVAETDHFEIIYPAHLAGIEAKAASIAEESYRVLSANTGVEFDAKIRIYLSDEDEINNGFAVPIGNGYTNIWVGVNDYAELWTGREKWLRKVIAHELAHIFHFEATRTGLGLLNYVVGDPTPPFWAEGFAQYQTEVWDSQRGDRWLRLAIFDSRPDYTDGQSLINRRLMYASGNAQLRYFSEVYGDTTLAEMLSKRQSLLGVAEYHDFETSFREATGSSYSDFYERWRKHMNIYYNSLASKMDRVDSLGVDPESLPGRYYFDLKYRPDRSQVAVLSLPSLQRPVRRLYIVDNDSDRTAEILAEGQIRNDLAWSPDGSRLAYSRTVRGERSSLVNDIFLIDLDRKKEEQLTRSRRAISPAFGPGGNRIAYIVNRGGTGNVMVLDLETMEESQVTRYEGDIQVITLNWNRHRNELIYQRFDEQGDRYLVLLNPDTGSKRTIDRGENDNRVPLVSPDGNRIAYTSLRDEVPNVFMADLDADSSWRVTHLFTGGEAYDWIPGDESNPDGKLAIKTTETKRSEQIYLLDAATVRDAATVQGEGAVRDAAAVKDAELVSEKVGDLAADHSSAAADSNRGAEWSRSAYATWRTRQPEMNLPEKIEPDETQIQQRYAYRSLSNLTHVVTLALPYYAGPADYGIAGFTSWVEPLGKHALVAGGNFSAGQLSNSFGVLSYMNNQLYPTLNFSIYRTPSSGRFYGSDYLVEVATGGELTLRWPLDRLEGPYRESWIDSRLRYASVTPHTIGEFSYTPSLMVPESGRLLDFRLGWAVKKQRPYYRNLIHPVDGFGFRVSADGASDRLGSDRTWFTTDFEGWMILPALGTHTLFLHGRFQAQFGDPFPQQAIGFSRFDNISLPIEAGPVNLKSVPVERVRGYREFLAAKQVAFGTFEYRIPFLPSLNTRILGFLELGNTSLALFADGGAIRQITISETSFEGGIRLGTGLELKNLVRIGPLRLVHSLGVAQPYDRLLEEDYDLYYRVRTVIPF